MNRFREWAALWCVLCVLAALGLCVGYAAIMWGP